MNSRIYIDGEAGTTGLQLRERLSARPDVTLLQIEPSLRKDVQARAELLRSADLAVLCLPDDAAREAVQLAREAPVRLLDASSAHRVAPDWIYGLPELAPEQRTAIQKARWVSNPGCYATAVVLLLRPLIDQKLLSPEAPISVHALSGYSGGGRQMIERWQTPEFAPSELPFEAPYALEREHKHLPEMTRFSGLARPLHFVPAVGPFLRGMRVEISLHQAYVAPAVGGARVHEAWADRYRSEPFVSVRPYNEPIVDRSFDPRRCNGSNHVELAVVENPFGHVLLLALLDNLGKGAAGAAVQNINVMLGLDENLGLTRQTA